MPVAPTPGTGRTRIVVSAENVSVVGAGDFGCRRDRRQDQECRRPAGGSVIREPIDHPYGRMSTVADDQGGVFSLLGVTPR